MFSVQYLYMNLTILYHAFWTIVHYSTLQKTKILKNLNNVGLIAEYPTTDLHKNSVYCILTPSSNNATKFKQ